MIDLLVGVSNPRRAAMAKAGLPIPSPVPIRGMIDSGASCTCLDPQIIKQLNLVATGAIPMLTPSTGATPVQSFQYDVSLIVGFGAVSFQFHALAVIESSLRPQGFDALIGRDVLAEGLFVYDGKAQMYSLAL